MLLNKNNHQEIVVCALERLGFLSRLYWVISLLVRWRFSIMVKHIRSLFMLLCLNPFRYKLRLYIMFGLTLEFKDVWWTEISSPCLLSVFQWDLDQLSVVS